MGRTIVALTIAAAVAVSAATAAASAAMPWGGRAVAGTDVPYVAAGGNGEVDCDAIVPEIDRKLVALKRLKSSNDPSGERRFTLALEIAQLSLEYRECTGGPDEEVTRR